jgi:hypothetical protein
VIAGPQALDIVALEDLRVSVSEFDGDVAHQLGLEAHRLHARDGLDDGRFAMRHVPNGANVNRRLAADDLGCERIDFF